LNKENNDARDLIAIKKEDLIKIKEAELFVNQELDVIKN